MDEVQREFEVFVWERKDGGMVVVRLVTSWATDAVEARRFCGVVEAWTRGS